MNALRVSVWTVGMLASLCVGCSPGPSGATCVAGATQACICTGGRSGVQACVAGGTFGACDCSPGPEVDAGHGMDAEVRPDASAPPDASAAADGNGADASGPAPDAATSDASRGDTGPSTCPSPLVECGGRCIDPETNPRYCGATADCAGASAGADCGGTYCSIGRCVYDTCTSARDAGATTDGLYLLDIDGSGPRAPMEAYCDMTTAGGGWTLVYRIRNDIPDISDPWWGMVALGAGETLPTDPRPLPVGTHFEGPVRETRAGFWRTSMAGGTNEVRVTTVSATGAIVLDTRIISSDYAIGYLIAGTAAAPMAGMDSRSLVLVIAASGGLPPAGSSGSEAFGTCTSGTCNDIAGFSPSAGPPSWVPQFGDTSVGAYGDVYGVSFRNTTALFWLRSYPPGPRP